MGDSKLCSRCCDLLAEALTEFPGDSEVWTWVLYALLQLVPSSSEFRRSQSQFAEHTLEIWHLDNNN